MHLPGWPAPIQLPLPDGWQLREDSHLIFLCSPKRVEAVFSAGISASALTVVALLVLETVRRRNGHVA